MSDVIVAALIASLAGIASAYATARFYSGQVKADLRKEFESRFNEKKWSTYTRFSKFVSDVFRTTVSNRKVNESKKVDELRDIAGEFWLVASSNVLERYASWQQHSRDAQSGAPGVDPKATLSKLAEIVVAMRKDLGYEDDNVTASGLLSIYGIEE